jgi:hypothetical protein
MSNSLKRTVAIITGEYLPDATIEEVAASMCDLAANMCCYVKFVYEGIEMMVSFHHTSEEMVKEWRKRRKMEGKVNVSANKH